MTDLPARTGARLLVDALRNHGADLAFSVAGESYLDVLDAFVDTPEMRLVTCRQEGGLSFMAEAYGKLTGRPGIGFVTRGPGACNAAIGVHTAQQDSSPMILFVGQVARDQTDREAFQEIDYRRMFGSVAKWAAQIDDAARVPEYVAHAFHTATSGRPGPVVLALPEDMLGDKAAVRDTGAYAPVTAHPGTDDLRRLSELLAKAERPMLLVGGPGWTDEACADIRAFAEANALPVCCSFRRQDILDNESPAYVGDLGTGANPALLRRVGEADLLLVVGARLGEITTQGYALLTPPEPGPVLIHAHPAAEEPGRVYRPTLGIQAGVVPMAKALAALAPVEDPPWRGWAEEARADWLAWLEPGPCAGAVDMGWIFGWLRDRLPVDAIVTNDAGNFSGWAHRHLLYRRPGRQLGPTNGAMGYGVPAAVAAKLVHPKRVVLGIAGDGGFLMTGQELATAVHTGAAPILLVVNNGMYGTIRMHQEKRFPGRVSATDLTNPDFAALAQSYGAHGIAVERTRDFVPAFWDAMWSRKPAVIELRVDPEQITTRTTLSALRQSATPTGAG
ncbi:thiamine pyrophosphate-binding protein [Azospirillum sp. RWY-5-1]|uniref:Thiamine pyrophosphate-binding protein n=1 Tax=Azospirillum oleiclasticum TaxID=2735135 RepID=A0ABX2TCN6_9PROT|nr:thiamine pyrophosphate-binding protein [Azospirillum oleiclasticum]NYZ13319.1 thiamine pyrophosphate-binding protein [Azospirillum oleiclasticum]NYZ20480.1 thiamine pyrophosphate-binding protein [Azospirillum oleiclasticum]